MSATSTATNADSGSTLTLEKLRKASALAARGGSVLKEDQPWLNWHGEIMESTHMATTHSRVRSWKERLLSRPWCPWKRLHVWTEPKTDCYLMDVGVFGQKKTVLVVHPTIAAQIRHAAASEGRADG